MPVLSPAPPYTRIPRRCGVGECNTTEIRKTVLYDICSSAIDDAGCAEKNKAIEDLCAEVERLRELVLGTRLIATAPSLQIENDRLRGALEYYGEHQMRCIRLDWEACEPGKGHKYRGKWYPKELPPCGCGLDTALHTDAISAPNVPQGEK